MRFPLPVLASTLILAAATATPALAQTPASPDPAKVAFGQYAVEPQHTQIEFAVSHLGFTTYYGRFSGASGSLRLDPHNPTADQLSVTIPTDSVSTTSAKLNDELKSADWFDAQRFPQITFKSTHVAPTGKADANVTGDLTMHGVTRPVTLSVHFVGGGVNPLDKKTTIGFQVTGHVKRSDFGVSKYVPLVGDDVTLAIAGAFEKQD
jgi:polyisoprenoid-binding protein YceI